MQATSRLFSLDLLRCVAAAQMVQGHTIDALLAPDYRHGAPYHAWIWLRGLTSVAFLFASGVSFNLATLRDLEGHRANPDAVAGRFRRALGLVLLGYLLRLPLPLPAELDSLAFAGAVERAFAVDVLQCIGVSLAALEALALMLRDRRAVEQACLGIGIALLALAPWLAGRDPRGAFLPLSNYLTAGAGSPFPLVPWAGHVFLGVGLAPILRAARLAPLRQFVLAAGLLACAALAKAGGLVLPADHLGRLAWVTVALALLSACAPVFGTGPRAWVKQLASETLAIYVFHVLLVYGRGAGLGDQLGQLFAPEAAIAAALVMIGLSFGVALSYRRALAGLAGSAATG